jgi:hypothetical protein
MKKQKLNLVDLRELLKGRKFSELSEEEQDYVLELIMKKIQPDKDKKFKKVDYKEKWFVIKDKEEELDYIIGEITKEEALEEDFVAKHKENCEYYGIPAYIGKDKDLKRIYD